MSTKPPTPEEQLAKLKDFALATGYPLENDVQLVLEGIVSLWNGEVERDVQFKAEMGDNDYILRSIDFKVDFNFPSQNIPRDNWPKSQATVCFLLDAKFTKGDEWWFVPSANKNSSRFPHLIPVLANASIYLDADLEIGKKQAVKAAECFEKWKTVAKGTKIKDQNRERESLQSAQDQIIQSVLYLMENERSKLGKPEGQSRKFSNNLTIYYPIIVTNGPLFVLKDGISRVQVERAKTQTDLCDPQDLVVIEQPHSYQMQALISRLGVNLKATSFNDFKWLNQDLNSFPVIMCRLEVLQSIMEEVLKRFNEVIEPN